jgi:hypothetical protein
MPAFPAASSSVRASHRRGAARPIPDATSFDRGTGAGPVPATTAPGGRDHRAGQTRAGHRRRVATKLPAGPPGLTPEVALTDRYRSSRSCESVSAIGRRRQLAQRCPGRRRRQTSSHCATPTPGALRAVERRNVPPVRTLVTRFRPRPCSTKHPGAPALACERSRVVLPRETVGNRPNQARDGRRAGRSLCASERKRRPVSRLALPKRTRQARRGRQPGEHPVRRGADDSDGGVSPTHRGRARSARRSRASRTSWSRSGPAGRLR